MKVGRTAQAEEHYKKAISLDPANADFEVSLGILYQEMKRYSEAIERYLKHQQKGGSDLRVQNWIRECNDGLGGRAK
jgi:tetratricopeptide (TPR) repeat protein